MQAYRQWAAVYAVRYALLALSATCLHLSSEQPIGIVTLEAYLKSN